MWRLVGDLALVGVVLAGLGGGAAEAQERVTVTVQQLFNQAHRIEVSEGCGVLWAGPHFDRVWFPAGSKSPQVERVPGGFRAVFSKAGDEEMTSWLPPRLPRVHGSRP